MKNRKLTFGIIMVFVFVASISFTYAYFSINVTGNNTAKNVITSTANLSLTYNGGTAIQAS